MAITTQASAPPNAVKLVELLGDAPGGAGTGCIGVGMFMTGAGAGGVTGSVMSGVSFR
jgi:hypothetical protein